MRLRRDGLVMLLLLFAAGMVRAEGPRTLVKGTPRILGREVEQLVLLVPLHVGRQKPGMPLVPEYDIMPNRFVAVSEDSDDIFFQAVARFETASIGASAGKSEGGLALSKTRANLIVPYRGDARNLRLPLQSGVPLEPEQVRRLKVGRSERRR